MIHAVRAEGGMRRTRTKVSNLEARRKAGSETLKDNRKTNSLFPSIFTYIFVLRVTVGGMAGGGVSSS